MMVKENCFRCKKPVYPTDKMGPLKDGAFFHHGCFKCYICGTRLSLRSYCNNRNDMEDQEVYCSSHVPLAGPHDPIPHRSNLVNSSNGQRPGDSPDGSARINGAASPNGAGGSVEGSLEAGVGDMKIAHALKATAVQKPYPKINHEGAKYVLDYDQQTRLELVHRKEEDDFYDHIEQQRTEEEQRFSQETKEEWEKALADLAYKYERIGEGHRGSKARDELIRQLTVKRDKQRETMHARRKERERSMTAELVDKQADEMMDLFKQARQTQQKEVKYSTHEVTETNGMHSRMNESSSAYHHSSSNGINGMNGLNGLPNGQSHGHLPNGHGPHGHLINGHGQLPNGHGHINGYTSTNGSQTESANGDMEYPTTPPPPFPPIGRKRDIYRDVAVFEVVDQTAISVAQSEQQTWTDLVRALTHNCKNDVEKARAIYRWITVKNLNLMEFDGKADANTPMGLLRGIKYGTESYHVLFKRLCSYAGLHCVVIKGYSKSAGYQPGMKFEDSRFRNTWNAVFLDGSWRFVQCNWGARHLVNAKDNPPGGRGAGRSDNLRYEYDDHYFMTDPEEFIYEFFPNQPEWQLLKRPISLHDFEELPFVRSLFFRYGLNFADANIRASVFADKTGAATVAINMSPEAISSLIFHYNLRFYHNEEAELNGTNLKRFVMQSVVGHSVVFRVHTPCRGEFLLDIFANAVTAGEYLTGQPMKFKSVCKFRVVCDHLNVIMVPLPECASGEWGPAKAYRLFGLIPLTHEDAIVNSGRELEIRFRMSKPLAEFVASLHKNSADERRLQRSISHSIRGDQVVFRVAFPEEGQYGLDIYTRESSGANAHMRGDKHLLTHCCKYLINARL